MKKQNTTTKKKMTLAQAIKRFERARTSPHDYKCIYYKYNGYNQHITSRKELEALQDCEVIEYKKVQGRCMTFSLETLRMSPEILCKAVSIFLNPDQARALLHEKLGYK